MNWMMEHVTFVLHRRKNQIIRFAEFKINHMCASTCLFFRPSITFRWTGGYFCFWICWEWLRRWFKTKSIEWGPFSVDYYSLVRVLVYLSWIKSPNLMVNIWPKILGRFLSRYSLTQKVLGPVRIPTVKLKILGKAFLKSESRISVTIKIKICYNKCDKRFSHFFHGSVLAKSQPLPLVDS